MRLKVISEVKLLHDIAQMFILIIIIFFNVVNP